MGRDCILRPIFNRTGLDCERFEEAGYKPAAGWQPAPHKKLGRRGINTHAGRGKRPQYVTGGGTTGGAGGAGGAGGGGGGGGGGATGFFVGFFAGFLAGFLAGFFAGFFAGFLAAFFTAFFAGFLAAFFFFLVGTTILLSGREPRILLTHSRPNMF